MKIIASNRKAKRDYEIIERYQAGIELKGMEVKSLRTRGCSIEDSFARIERMEVLLYNMHIPEFEKSSYFRPDPKRARKLLFHKKEIKKLLGLTTQKGLTLIATQVSLNQRGWVKIDIALAKGKKAYDKRKKIKEEIQKKEAERILKKYR
ncbi:MAG: SsrA-binding protein SmpB [Candidatus Omnitrophota bacterium]